MQGVDRRLCSLLREGDEFGWVSKDVVGRSGGLLVLWKKDYFELSTYFVGSNFLGVEGFWGKERIKVSLINVYAPCELRGKRLLWEEIAYVMELRGGERWCVMGDFNSIKDLGERKGVDGFNRSEEVQTFGC